MEKEDVLLYGKNGLLIKAKTKHQQELVNAVNLMDMVFAIGPAGTGKSYTSVLGRSGIESKRGKANYYDATAVEAGEN